MWARRTTTSRSSRRSTTPSGRGCARSTTTASSGFLKRQVGNVDLAEDLAQDAFLGAVRGIKGFDRRYNVEQYLMGIARNKAIDQLRRKKVEVHVTDRDEDSSGLLQHDAVSEGASCRARSRSRARRSLRQKDVLVDCLRDMVRELREQARLPEADDDRALLPHGLEAPRRSPRRSASRTRRRSPASSSAPSGSSSSA